MKRLSEEDKLEFVKMQMVFAETMRRQAQAFCCWFEPHREKAFMRVRLCTTAINALCIVLSSAHKLQHCAC